ncbi:MAG: NAD-dependent epimerase/dehydratase family protein [Pyrinomonadaceae bacterium]|nr:NAD-dependent epimerase/dehydratase family protein [Pyrinomonadaceae bacterium]
MKVLVTGGSGYLGTHVRKFFDADDLSRRNGRDLLDIDSLGDVSKYDAVIHMAARLDRSFTTSAATFQTNVQGTINLLERVRKDAAFVFISSKDVYGCFAGNYQNVPETCQTMYSGQSAHEWSKLIAEHYVDYYAHQRAFRSCIFRLATPYAPPSVGNTPNIIGHFANAINLGERIRLPGKGRPIRDILHVDDLAAACRAFIDSIIRHGTYNIGGGPKNALSLREIVSRMEAVSGLQAVIDDEHPLPDPMPYNYVTDLSRIDQELEWEPKIGIDDGLKTLF